jgi:hypothetical protein
MKTKFFATIAVAALLVAGTFAVAQAPTPTTKPDPRIDKVLDQNALILKNQEQILKNQEEMIKSLSTIQEGMIQLRRRSS